MLARASGFGSNQAKPAGGASKVKGKEKRSDENSMANIGTDKETVVEAFRIRLPEDADEKNNQVPPNVYTVTKTDDSKIYLEIKCAKYPLPDKLYGKSIYRRSNIIADEYKRSDKSIGILLTGQKGCGKSNQAEYVCNCAMEAGMPVLFIDKALTKEIMEDTIRRVGPCIVFIDEYSKIYRSSHEIQHDQREELLTLFSDRTLPKCVFMLTDNQIHQMSSYMIERPGRFCFHFQYEGCDKDVIEDICNEYGCNDEIREFIVKHARNVKESIDSVLALARFGCRYDTVKNFTEVFEYLNVKRCKFPVYRLEAPADALKFLTGEVIDGEFNIWYKRGVEGKEQHFVKEKSCKFRNMYRYNIIDNDEGIRCNAEIRWEDVVEEPEENYKMEGKTSHDRWL